MMEKNKKSSEETLAAIEGGFVNRFWKKSWTYIKTVVDVVHEPVLVLDKDLRVLASNDSFYKVFQVDPKDTEGKIVYELGNGQWDIPDLRKLLEDILPKNTFFKGFEVNHDFPVIGKKTMILNARQIYVEEEDGEEDSAFPPIILLAMEDITEMMNVAEMLANHTKQFESQMTDRTKKLDGHIKELEKEVNNLKNKK